MLVLLFFMLLIFMFTMDLKIKWYSTIWLLLLSFFFIMKFMYSSLFIPKLFLLNLYLDNLSTPLILLSIWISALMILSSYKIYMKNNNIYMFLILIMILNFIIVNMFMQKNFFSLYIFFEASLIPTFILIMVWGYQPERLQASMYIILYTVMAALPLLVNMIFLFTLNGHFSLLLNYVVPEFSKNFSYMSIWLFFMLFAFLVKLPLFLVHLWLPKAHVEAPISGSMILAALLLKLGGYSIIRVMIMFPKINMQMNVMISTVALIGGVLSSMVCVRQNDMKSLIAYSSIGHMGLMLSGILSMTQWGYAGGSLMMIAHGLSSSGLFCIANMLYEKSGSRSLYVSKGNLNILPNMSMYWFLLCSVNMAAPPSINLLSEISLIISILSFSVMFVMFLIFMTFMAAVYNLFLYTMTQHGEPPLFLSYYNSSSTLSFMLNFMHWGPTQLLILKSEFLF
uniref:NADH-ubiquinone oxidoreductase chain 4 n=1 Tax=Callochiton steinenii TaxID=2719128 RepID=A0A6H1PH30_9MOLL|nr:NADH dehydrogenase subunit 4 [Callochiton steinenii]